jgi:hypothetical protein
MPLGEASEECRWQGEASIPGTEVESTEQVELVLRRELSPDLSV